MGQHLNYGWQDAGNAHRWWMLLVMAGIALVVIALVAVFLFTRFEGAKPSSAEPSRDKAVEQLRERFAQGKIDEDDFRSRMSLLAGPAKPNP